jgi:hypothetical protein
MSETVTKTLQATLAPPTRHKERKLRDTLATYRDALDDAFEAGASTMSAVNDIVTPYDFTYRAMRDVDRFETVESHQRELLEDQGRSWPPSSDRGEPTVYGDDAKAFDYDGHLAAARREYEDVTDRTGEAVEAGRAHRVYDDATYKFTVAFDSERDASTALARFREAGYYAEEKRDERYSSGVNPAVLVVVPTGEATPIDEKADQ